MSKLRIEFLPATLAQAPAPSWAGTGPNTIAEKILAATGHLARAETAANGSDEQVAALARTRTALVRALEHVDGVLRVYG